MTWITPNGSLSSRGSHYNDRCTLKATSSKTISKQTQSLKKIFKETHGSLLDPPQLLGLSPRWCIAATISRQGCPLVDSSAGPTRSPSGETPSAHHPLKRAINVTPLTLQLFEKTPVTVAKKPCPINVCTRKHHLHMLRGRPSKTFHRCPIRGIRHLRPIAVTERLVDSEAAVSIVQLWTRDSQVHQQPILDSCGLSDVIVENG